MCITECMTGLGVRQSTLTHVMRSTSQNGHFAVLREGVDLFYTVIGEGC
jgi:hypothetical protein